MLIAYANDQPIGFAYGTISQVTPEHLFMKPSWAADLEGAGSITNIPLFSK